MRVRALFNNMKIYRKRLLYFIPVLALCAASSTMVCAENLQQAVRAAIVTHPSIATAKAGSEEAVQDQREQRSDYYPTVGVNGSAGRIYGNNATSRGLSVTRGAGYSNLWNGSVSATEKIFTGFQTSNRIRSAEARKTSADFNVMDVRESVAYRAVQSYVDLMRAQEGLAMLNAHGKKVDDYMNRIKKMVDDGGSDEAEYQQARDIRVILDGLTDDYKGQVKAAESNYFDMMGYSPEGKLDRPVVPVEMIPSSLQDALTHARTTHASVQAAQHTAKSAEYDIEAEKGTLYPTVEGELSYMEEEKEDIIGGEVEDARAVVNLNWSFDTGGAQLARIGKRKAARAEAMSRELETQRQVELGVRLAWAEYETAREQADNYEKRRALNEKLFSTYKIQFEGSKITLLQLMQADNQLFTTGLEKMNGQYRLIASEYAILSSMGKLQNSLRLASILETEPAAGTPVPETRRAAHKKAAPAAIKVESIKDVRKRLAPPAKAEDCVDGTCGVLTKP
jgi:adhesin transport system outer membrane protein